MRGWESLEVTHLSINTMGSGFDTPAKHLEAIARFAAQMGVSAT
jgi:hypothetical protein